jgi:hypothetical protein
MHSQDHAGSGNLARMSHWTCASLMVLVVFIGACSSSHRSAAHASSVSRTPKTPTCPTELPNLPIKSSPVKGLATELVPIAATSVRVCKYSTVDTTRLTATLAGTTQIGSGPIVTSLQREMNAFAPSPKSSQTGDCPNTPLPWFLVTFYGPAASVDIAESLGCGWISNGVRVVEATPRWRDELAALTVCHGCFYKATTTSVDG